MADQAVSSDLIIKLPAKMTAEYFTNEDEMEKLISSVKKVVDAHVPDLSTASGRAATKSVAYQVSQTKAEIIRQGKKLTEGWREQTKKVNAACNTFEERFDALRDQVRKPVTDWEDQEKSRIESHKARLSELVAFTNVGFGCSSEALREMLAKVHGIALGPAEWQEFAPQASVAHQDAIDSLTRYLATAEKQEKEAAELEQLRAEKAERDRQEEERRAAEAAKREEEERAEREQLAEQQRKDALVQAAKEAAERVERENAARVAAAEFAAKEAQERAEREIAEAKEKAEREAEAERQRIAAEKAAEEEAQRRRDEDREHRRLVNNSIIDALISCAGITEQQGQKIVIAIVDGSVPHVTLKY